MANLALNLSSISLNIKELDNKPCALCGEIPQDRNSRIDCDCAGKKGSTPMTYHKACWIKACKKYVPA